MTLPSSRAASRSRGGAWAFAGLTGGVVVGCLGGLGGLAYYAFPVVATGLALALIRRGDWEGYFFFVLLLWVLSPGIRRFVEFYSGYQPQSLILVTAPSVSLLGIVILQYTRLQLSRRLFRVAVLVVLAVTYGVITGVVFQGVVATSASAVQWVAPLCLGIFLMALPADRLRAITAALPRYAVALTGVLAVYGLVQFFVLPEWDAQWLRDVSGLVSSFGEPEPLRVRIFSLSNSPGPFAILLVWLMLVGFTARPRLLAVLVTPVALLVLALTEVRTAWILLVLTLPVLLVRRAVRPGAIAGIAVLTAAAAAALPTQVREGFVERLQTAQSAGNDVSLLARLQFQIEAVPQLLSSPFGFGLGSTGAGVRAGDGGGANSNVDSGFVDILFSFGLVIGAAVVLYLLYVLWTECQPGGVPAEVRAHSAFCLVFPLLMALGTSLSSLGGVLFWVSVVVAGRSGGQEAVRVPERERAVAA